MWNLLYRRELPEMVAWFVLGVGLGVYVEMDA